jgi:N-glycosylase/DNA lyase
MKKLTSEYKAKKYNIKKRLREFRRLRKAKDEDIFEELCFCILTPQSKAVSCDRAVRELKKCGLLFRGHKDAISGKLRGHVRFHNNKAAYIVNSRELLSAQGGSAFRPRRTSLRLAGGRNGKLIDIKSKLDKKDILKTREWFVKNIKGLGYKEASHFLRNIGLGKDIAIIDRHILQNLKRHGVIKKIPAAISKKTYADIEDKMRRFAKRANIPVEELDLLFWSKQTGYIYK